MPPARNAALVGVALLVAYVVGGASLLALFGNNFIASYVLHPALLTAVLGVTALVIGAFVVRLFREQRKLSSRVLSLAAFVLFTGTSAVALFGASRGWVAAASELLPKQPAVLELTVLSVGRSESRRSMCHHHLELRHGSTIERLCADKLPLQGRPVEGRPIRLVGAASLLGFHIHSLRAPRIDA